MENQQISNVEDLGLKMGTPELKIFTDFKKALLTDIETAERSLILNKAMLKMAEERISEEERKV